MANNDTTTLVAEIVSAAASNEASRMRPEDLVDLIKAVRSALTEDLVTQAKETTGNAPAMTKSQWSKLITPSGIKSLLDGKIYKTMKRHLGRHGHDAKSYREAYGLPADFPMVAPEYSAARSALAKERGLGAQGKRGGKTSGDAAKRSRKPKVS